MVRMNDIEMFLKDKNENNPFQNIALKTRTKDQMLGGGGKGWVWRKGVRVGAG